MDKIDYQRFYIIIMILSFIFGSVKQNYENRVVQFVFYSDNVCMYAHKQNYENSVVQFVFYSANVCMYAHMYVCICDVWKPHWLHNEGENLH